MNNESKQFINWAIKVLEDDNLVKDIQKNLEGKMENIYSRTNRTKFLKDLRAKMEQGANEHGKPEEDTKQIMKEI